MTPPYTITARILELVASISEKTGVINTFFLNKPTTILRRLNRIQTIHSSLGIEGNTMTIEQVSDIIDNRAVIGPAKDILEVRNAIAVYDMLRNWKPYSLRSFCSAHAKLMNGLVNNPGVLRTEAVGIVKGSKLIHLPPPGHMVKPLMNDLFKWLKSSNDMLLLKSCVMHYELEFIHPFVDGNGRMGRLWQTLLLKEYHPVFEFVPVEQIIRKKQKEYYNVLSMSDKSGNSTVFVEFMLSVIDESLHQLLQTRPPVQTAKDRIEIFSGKIEYSEFSRKDYLRFFKNISSATASRDLQWAYSEGILSRSGEKNKTIYRFVDKQQTK